MIVVDIRLPMKLESEANLHEHWSKKSRRTKEHRGIVKMALWKDCTSIRRGIPEDKGRIGILLTRVGPRLFDDDNNCRALKSVRDGVADALGIDDGDPRLEWRVTQKKGPAKVYSVEITVAWQESL